MTDEQLSALLRDFLHNNRTAQRLCRSHGEDNLGAWGYLWDRLRSSSRGEIRSPAGWVTTYGLQHLRTYLDRQCGEDRAVRLFRGRSNRRPAGESIDLSEPRYEAEPPVEIERTEHSAAVHAELGGLPPERRGAFLAAHKLHPQGLSLRKYARLIGKSHETVRQWAKKDRIDLRTRLEAFR